jgi:NO-binding membrane sensor protein with MHYT domain
MLPASRALTSDLMLFGLAAVIFMVVEARKQGIKFVWLYVAASYIVAISAAFPAFLIAREIRISKSDAPGVNATDTILLAVVAIFTALLTIWIDLG